MNSCVLSGRLGAPPELRYTKAGTAVMNARLATNERMPDGEGGWKNQTEWHSIVIWGKRAESLMKVLDKGSHILIEGRLRQRQWIDAKDQKHWVTEVHATNVELLGGGKKNNSAEESSLSGSSDEEPPYTDEDAPF